MIRKIRIKAKKNLPNILLLAITLLVCFFLLEAFLRLSMDKPDSCSLYQEDHELVYASRPGFDYQCTTGEFSVNYRTNEDGLREDEVYRGGKPAGELRILTIGDSFTWGYGLEQEDTYQKKLERKLEAGLGKEVSVINAGVCGYGSEQSLGFLRREIVSYEPDIVIYGFYINDVEDDEGYQGLVMEGGCLMGKDVGTIKKALYLHSRTYLFMHVAKNSLIQGVGPIRNAVYLVRKELAKVGLAQPAAYANEILASNYTREFEAAWERTLGNIQKMDNLCSEHSCTFAVMYIPSKLQLDRGFREEYLTRNAIDPASLDIGKPSRILSSFTGENGIPFIDLMEALRCEDGASLYFKVDTHFNENGSEEVSKVLYKETLRMFEDGKEQELTWRGLGFP